MSLLATLNEKRQERKRVLDAAGAIINRAGRDNRALTWAEDQEFNRRHDDGDRLLKDIERMERQVDAERNLNEVRADARPAGREDIGPAGYSPPGYDPADRRPPDAGQRREERAEALAWMRGTTEGLTPNQRDALAHRVRDVPAELRALSASTGGAGAYTIPTGFQYDLDVALKSYGGVLAVADYIDTDMGNLLPWPTMNDTTNSGEIVAENTAVAVNQDPSFGVVNFNAYMFDSGIVKLPIQLLQDSAFDPESWMNDLLPVRLGRRLNSKSTTGTGANEPTGVLTASTAGVTAAGASALAYNDLLDLEHSVDPAYRDPQNRGRFKTGWMFNDGTLKQVKKLTDGNGRPLFIAGGTAQGIQGSAPDTIDGYPYTINQDFPSIGTGNKSVAFGAWSKFKIRRVRSTQLLRLNERYIDSLQVGFLAFARYDSNLIDSGTHPLKHLVHP